MRIGEKYGWGLSAHNVHCTISLKQIEDRGKHGELDLVQYLEAIAPCSYHLMCEREVKKNK